MLKVYRWLASVIIGLLVTSINITPLSASPVKLLKEPDISLTMALENVILGDVATWYVTITPPLGQGLENFTLRPVDTDLWYWTRVPTVTDLITGSQVIAVTVVPLVTGNLKPVLQATYTVSNIHQTRLVMAGHAMQVHPVEDYVQTSIIVDRDTVKMEESLEAEIWIHNQSPFILKNIQARGVGVDLEWEPAPSFGDLLPDERKQHIWPLTIQDAQPQPQLSLTYTWTDFAGQSYVHTVSLVGKSLTVEKSLVERIPGEFFGLLVGVIAGVLSTFFTGLIAERLKQHFQRATNCRHTYGVLRLVIKQTIYAADNGIGVELDPLETLFKEEGLYTVLIDQKLYHKTQELWEKAMYYNHRLNLSGGSRRSKELKDLAQKLEGELKEKSC